MATQLVDESILYNFYNMPNIRGVLSENSIYQALFFAENALESVGQHVKVLSALILMSNVLMVNAGMMDQFRNEYNKYFNVNIDRELLRTTMNSITLEMQDEYALYQRKPKYKG